MSQRDSDQPGWPDPAERDLLRRLVAGDVRAWREFVELHQSTVFNAARRTADSCRATLGPSDLEDITADVFAALIANDYAALRRFEGRSRLSTWLTVLARRRCLRFLQRKQRSAGRHLREDQGVTDSADSPLARLIQAEDSARLRQALRKLNNADRTVLNLYYDQRLGYAEIGRQLGISENSVGSRIQRVHQRLQRILNGHRPETLTSRSRNGES